MLICYTHMLLLPTKQSQPKVRQGQVFVGVVKSKSCHSSSQQTCMPSKGWTLRRKCEIRLLSHWKKCGQSYKASIVSRPMISTMRKTRTELDDKNGISCKTLIYHGICQNVDAVYKNLDFSYNY